jgi:hypothetical protein
MLLQPHPAMSSRANQCFFRIFFSFSGEPESRADVMPWPGHFVKRILRDPVRRLRLSVRMAPRER